MELISGVVRVLPAHRGLLRVVLNKPATGNGITPELVSGLHHALDAAEGDGSVRVVLLESSGELFCSGMDLDAAGAYADGDEVTGADQFFRLLRRFTTTPRLMACHVDGRTVGGGVGLVASCDLVFATNRASFALPEALWGLIPCCVMPFLMRRVGFQPAHRMALTTQPIGPHEALRIHLADELIADVDCSLRHLVRRVQRIDAETIGDAKRYTAQLWFSGANQEQQAVAEFTRLMSSARTRQRIQAFVRDRVVG